MKKSVLLSLVLMVSVAHAKKPSLLQRLKSSSGMLQTQDLESFYDGLGFNTRRVVRDLSDRSHVTPAMKQVLQERYLVLDLSKKISATVLTKVFTSQDPEMLNRAIEATARLLNTGLQGLPDELPARVQSLTGNKKEMAALDFMGNAVVKAIDNTRAELLTEILGILYTETQIQSMEVQKSPGYIAEKTGLDVAISHLARSLYSDFDVNQTRLLGKAFALGLLRYAKLQNQPLVAQKLAAATLAKGSLLDQFVGSDFVTLACENLCRRSLTDGEFLFIERALVNQPKDNSSASYKNFWKIFKSRPTAQSSYGQVRILKDQASDLKVIWILSSQPQPKFSDLNGFAPPGITKKIWMSRAGVSLPLFHSPELSESARVYQFYSATRPPSSYNSFQLINASLAPTVFDPLELQFTLESIKNSEEFRQMMKAPKGKEDLAAPAVVSAAPAATLPVKALTEQQMREFLFELGFEDLSAQIREYYIKGMTYTLHSQAQQARNIKSYEMINAGRELAILLFSRLQNRLATPQGTRDVARLAGRLLSQQSSNKIKKIPTELMSLPEDKRSEAIDQYVAQMARLGMEEQTQLLTSDLLMELYPRQDLLSDSLEASRKQEIEATAEKIYKALSVLIERMYMDTHIGKTQFLGRAFVALLARSEEVTGRSDIMRVAKQEIGRYGLRLENYLGDEWVMDSQAGPTKVKVDDLSYVFTRAVNPESVTIPFGAIPHDDLYARAGEMGMLGNIAAMPLVLTPDSVASGYTLMARLKDKSFYEYLKNGFSHIGQAVKKTTKNSKIVMMWMLDNYPHTTADNEDEIKNTKHNSGGLRMAGLEQYYATSHHSRMAVSRMDKNALYAFAMQTIKEKGIPQTGKEVFPFENYVANLDEMGKPMIPQAGEKLQRKQWTITTAQAQINDLYASKNAEEFWQRYVKLINEGFMDKLKRGMTFVWITPYGKYFYGGGYCSSTLVINSETTTGLTLEPKASQWRSFVSWVSSIKEWGKSISFIGENEDLTTIAMMPKMGIVAPSSLAVQEFVAEVQSVDAPIQSIRRRAGDDYGSQVERDSFVFRRVRQMISEPSRKFFSQYRFDMSEVRARHYDILHFDEIRRGVLGLHTGDERTVRQINKLQGAKTSP